MSRLASLVVPGLGVVAAAGVVAHGCGRGKGSPAPAGSVEAGAPAASAATLPSERRGNLSFVVRDRAGHALPCKLTLLGREGTPDPDLAHGQPTAAIEGGLVAHQRAFSSSGSGSFAVPAGTYDVHVSRGLEWSLHVERVRVGAEPVALAVTLTEVVPTPGWLSTDMHVHAAPSWDSDVPLAARVHEFVSEGVDVLVATDHNIVTDYRPEIDRAGVRELLGTVAGSEVSTTDWGHFGAFPMRDEKGWWVLHGVRMNGMTPAELLGALRRHDPAALVTVNHPRLGKLGYFSIGGFDPASARFLKPRVSFEFDAVEVMNGAKHGSIEAVDRVMEDWFALLRSGRRVTAVGNSDTHELVTSYAGYPRNYVALAESGPLLDGDRLAAAFREGRSFFTSGPFLKLQANGGSYGDLVHAKQGRVTLSLEVRAAPWVSVSRVRVYLDGEVKKELTLPASEEPTRLSTEISLETPADAFVVVRVDGDRALPPIVGGPPSETLFPIAVTNPVYVDADGDGKYRARGGR